MEKRRADHTCLTPVAVRSITFITTPENPYFSESAVGKPVHLLNKESLHRVVGEPFGPGEPDTALRIKGAYFI